MGKFKKATTFGLSSGKVARLLGINAEEGQTETSPSETDMKAELLRDRLAETLSLHEVESAPSKQQTQMTHAIADLAGEPIGNLLLDPSTDLAVIRRIKDHGRRLAQSARSEAERRVAHTVYYAAIGSALVGYGTRITTFSYQELRDSFARLGKESWIPNTMINLLSEACEYCEALM